MATQTEQGTFYSLDAPQKEGKEGYVGTYFSQKLNIDAILRSPDFNKEPMKVYYQTLNIISSVQGKDIRKGLYDDLDTLIKQMEDEYKKVHEDNNIPPSDQTHIVIVASLKILGTVTDYFGKYVPLTSENRIGYCLDSKDKVIIEKMGDDDFVE